MAAAEYLNEQQRYETTANDLLALVKTKKAELLFVALFLRLFKSGGERR